MRKKAPLIETYLCAIKFWRATPDVGTLASGVRHVVRSQNFKSSDIYQVERELQRAGLITVTGKLYKSVGLTPKGERQAKCRSVKLSPWTDKGYPGAELDGFSPAKVRKAKALVRKVYKKKGCSVSFKREGDHLRAIPKCPKRK